MLKYLIHKEFKQLIRNPFLPRLIFIFPVFMMILLPWAANMEVKDIRLHVVDNDRSPLSGRLIRKIAASGRFIWSGSPTTHSQAMEAIQNGTADAILEIPPHFERHLMRTEASPVRLAANAVNAAKASIAGAYITTIIADYQAELRGPAPVGPASAPAAIIIGQMQFNPHLDYKYTIVPALMVILLTLLCGFLPALNIVSEKEKGTIEQINVTPVSRHIFILAKLIPYWAAGFIVLTLCIAMARLFYGIRPAGPVLAIYACAAIFIPAVSGFGLLVSNHSATLRQAMFTMFFCLILFVLMSGLFTPIASMPAWAQFITRLNPLRYMIEAMRTVYLKGGSLQHLHGQLFALAAFAVTFNAWAVISYRKNH
ncbi:MAG: ABC transporter permease [Mediterranea sp.]|jgi:ABC-2 type transport system permease protein|nr:ABC transporter permease [Mediterranea sp.]